MRKHYQKIIHKFRILTQNSTQVMDDYEKMLWEQIQPHLEELEFTLQGPPTHTPIQEGHHNDGQTKETAP